MHPSGKLLWKSPVLQGAVFSTPAVGDDGTVFVGVMDPATPLYLVNADAKTFYALNGADGTEKWAVVSGDDVYSSPSLVEGLVIFGNDQGRVIALNQVRGRVSKRCSVLRGKHVHGVSGMCTGCTIACTVRAGTRYRACVQCGSAQYVLHVWGSSPHASLHCAQSDGSTVWSVSTVAAEYKWPATAPIRTSPAITADGHVVVKAWPHTLPGATGSGAILHILSSKTGETLWNGGEQYQSVAPVLIDGSGR